MNIAGDLQRQIRDKEFIELQSKYQHTQQQITEANEDNTNHQLKTEMEKLVVKKKKTCIDDAIKQNEDLGGFEDGRLTKAYFNRFRFLEQSCAQLSLFGIIIVVIEFDLEFEERDKETAIVLIYIVFLSTVLLALVTILRYQAKLEWSKARKIISNKATLFSQGEIKWMLTEILINFIMPYPWLVFERYYFDNEPMGVIDAYYHVNEILTIILMLRIFYITRTLLQQSFWFTNRAHRVCSMYACDSNNLFVIKCIVKNTPITFISIVLILSIFYFGFLIRACESPLASDREGNFHNYGNCIWYVIVTMTTVGYGDYAAKTDLGRFIIFITCIWGVFIVSMMVVTLTNILQTSSLEQKAILVMDKLQCKKEMKVMAAKVISIIVKIGIANRKKSITMEQLNMLIIKFRKTLNMYKMVSRQYKSICDENISEEMTRQFDFLREDFKQLYDRQMQLLNTNMDIMNNLKISKHIIKQYQFDKKMLSINSRVLKKIKSTLLFKKPQIKLQKTTSNNNDYHNIFSEEKSQKNYFGSEITPFQASQQQHQNQINIEQIEPNFSNVRSSYQHKTNSQQLNLVHFD